ncbi:SDR family NAD(P)-dependent oxidoreductase [Thalassobacillus hwangdonensis]|uniref:SDR family NAD(P)-dependent oxidoreductase n=1 Tax=Thalassobacillus hwangdonensis TaxID=546108 RepID=A0ABW3L222_9BACI
MESRKTAVVTGGANGIGKSIVHAFADIGYTVLIVDKDKEAGQKLSDDLRANGAEVIFQACDVGVVEEVQQLFHTVKETYESIDILVNNAGVSEFKNFWEAEACDWDKVIASNLSSMFYMTKEAAGMMKDKGGSIINIASTRASMAEPHTEAYSASKGGIVALTHSLAMTLSEHYIRVNCISPGWIQTEEYESLRDVDHFQHPSKRVGKPEDIARACVFLSKEENDFINGENMVIDGGMTKKMIYEH